ncbi:MAG: 2-oxoglutarate and iron-dependent oxygenase domain-containing protein, partial [Nonomuraea sp.]|nr:2-oxoglutarate and iron-dependent oxygenase domain-containing protein [Nonomuraea sp.]
MSEIPVIDIAPLLGGGPAGQVAEAIGRACRDSGFFYVSGHGVPAELIDRLDAGAR